MAQFSCKPSCTPNLWNPRSGRLDGKSREAVEVNAKIDKMLLNINSAYDNLLKRNVAFTAQSIQKSEDNNIKMWLFTKYTNVLRVPSEKICNFVPRTIEIHYGQRH